MSQARIPQRNTIKPMRGSMAEEPGKQMHTRARHRNDWLVSEDSYDWLSEALAKKGIRSPVKKVMVSNHSEILIEAVKQDLGVIQLPCFWGDREAGLVRVDDLPEDMMKELWLLTHEDLRNTARVRALMTFLHEACSQRSI